MPRRTRVAGVAYKMGHFRCLLVEMDVDSGCAPVTLPRDRLLTDDVTPLIGGLVAGRTRESPHPQSYGFYRMVLLLVDLEACVF